MNMEGETANNISQSGREQSLTDIGSTLEELQTLLNSRRTSFSHRVDEVWPNLFLGDLATANNRYELWKIGITHILNAAHGNRFCEGSSYFYSASISYYGVPAYDLPDFDMSQYFNSASQFIHRALNTSGARLLVHCIVGISRSATLVLAYLMIHHQMTLTQAIQKVQENRWVSPNHGFLRQLLKLDGELRKSRNIQR